MYIGTTTTDQEQSNSEKPTSREVILHPENRCRERESNPHGREAHQFLRLNCLPFQHLGIYLKTSPFFEITSTQSVPLTQSLPQIQKKRRL